MSYKIEDLGYIAGIIDSDGYVGLVRHFNKRRTNCTASIRATVALAQTKREAIDLIHLLFGGRVYEYEEQGENQKNLYHLQLTRRIEMIRFLTAILPYLRIKRQQAEQVLAFCLLREKRLAEKGNYSSKNTYGSEEQALWQTVRQLNRTGKEK